MNNAKPPMVSVPLNLFGGLYTEASPEGLPEGASPLVINDYFSVGSVQPRPGKQNVYSPAGSGAGVQNILVQVSAAAIKAAHGTPITLIPAPGPNLLIVPISVVAQYNFVTIPYTASSGGVLTPFLGLGTAYANILSGYVFALSGLDFQN